MGIELGIDLFIFGGEVFHKAIFHLLGVGYELLGREPYIDIIQVSSTILFHVMYDINQGCPTTDHLGCTTSTDISFQGKQFS